MNDEAHWLLRPGTIRGLWILFAIVLVTVVVIGALVDLHPHFTIDAIFGFYAWFGFLTCAVIIIIAKLLGLILKRRADYYDDDAA